MLFSSPSSELKRWECCQDNSVRKEVILPGNFENIINSGSTGEYQADEQAGVAGLSWRVSGR